MAAVLGNQEDALKLFLAQPGSNVAVARASDGRTALHMAFTPRVAQSWVLWALLDRPELDLNSRDHEGRTALMYMAQRPCHGKSKYLLRAPCLDVHILDNDGRSAISHAVCSSSEYCVRVLLENCVPVEPLLTMSPRLKDGGTHLHAAVLAANVLAVQRLLSAGADVEARDDKGRTPLELALELMSTLLGNGVTLMLARIVAMLKAKGAASGSTAGPPEQ